MLNTGTAIGVMCNVLPAGPAPAEARAVLLRGPLRPGGARASRSSRCSRRPGSSWAAAARPSPRSRTALPRPLRADPPGARAPFQKVHEHRGERWPLAACRAHLSRTSAGVPSWVSGFKGKTECQARPLTSKFVSATPRFRDNATISAPRRPLRRPSMRFRPKRSRSNRHISCFNELIRRSAVGRGPWRGGHQS